MSNALRKFRVLIADSDMELAKVLRTALHEMGFEQVQLTRSGQEAFYTIQSEAIDFLITEWNTQHMDGAQLIQAIRKDPASNKPTLPIMMATGRAEQSDVTAARDAGVNEYIIKPFSPRSVFSRLERLIEKPRPFVVGKDFVGPCRRHVGAPPPGVSDRRKTVIIPKLQPADPAKVVRNNTGTRLWLPDFSLKYKLGVNVTLQSLITPEVLEAAQAAINAISDETMQWVKEDLMRLRNFCEQLKNEQPPASISNDISELALAISSRAGTFGFKRVAEIAYMLYLFARNEMQPLHQHHQVVIGKYAQVLQVMLGNNMRGDGGEMGAKIASELRNLAQKNL